MVMSARAGRGVMPREVGVRGFPPARPRRACVGEVGAQQAPTTVATGSAAGAQRDVWRASCARTKARPRVIRAADGGIGA